MTCTHIKIIRQKLKNFTEKFGKYDSSIYEKLDSVVKKSDIGAKLDVTYKGFFSGNDYKAVATYKDYNFHHISQKFLKELCDEIDDLLEECKCYQDVVQDKEDEKKKNKEKKKSLRNELITKEREKSELGAKKEGSDARLEIFKDEKEKLEKENKQLEEVIGRLREKRAENESDNKKLREDLVESLEREFDRIIEQLELEEEETNNLIRIHKQLYQAEEKCNLREIEIKEKRIVEIKKELKKKIGFDNSKMVIEKCKKIAELKFRLEQRQEATQHFQTNIEIPPKS